MKISNVPGGTYRRNFDRTHVKFAESMQDRAMRFDCRARVYMRARARADWRLYAHERADGQPGDERR